MKSSNPLVFVVRHLDEGENYFEVEADINALNLGSYNFLEPLRCNVLFTRTGARLDLKLDIHTKVELMCSSCGEPIESPITATTDVTFLPQEEEKNEDEEFEALDLEYYYEEIDTAPIIRDAFLLSLPIALLCREDCKGLCPSCGANLNLRKCSCKAQNTPSPFEKLRRIIDG